MLDPFFFFISAVNYCSFMQESFCMQEKKSPVESIVLIQK